MLSKLKFENEDIFSTRMIWLFCSQIVDSFVDTFSFGFEVTINCFKKLFEISKNVSSLK